ncbi:hypothetical protein [Vandammella animalimorsus]|uniref:hypothetical protein n=1 Tax=Vandammella animalimorsus TaxID=2029117 RepID=UPI001EEF487B|nr:hypothetical protein [Vandammella animalimorsus]
MQAVAQNQAVLPVAFVLVEVGALGAFGQAVEVAKQLGLLHISAGGAVVGRLAQAAQVVDQGLGFDLFLDVQRRGVDDEVAPVLLVLAAPDQLRIQLAIEALLHGFVRPAHRVCFMQGAQRVQPLRIGARIAGLPGRALRRVHDGLVLGGGDVLARGPGVDEVFHADGGFLRGFAGGFGLTGHEGW